MSLSSPAPRRALHKRTIHCDGYRRDDGLWDIEATILDIKHYGYQEPVRGRREAGDPVHRMTVRLTIDDDMVVRGIEVSMPETPYPSCDGAIPAYRQLIGQRIGGGWRKAVNAAVGGTRGCTHVRELLFPMATVAFQTLGGWAEDPSGEISTLPADQGRKPYFIDGCRAWAADGEVVARFYPRFSARNDTQPT